MRKALARALAAACATAVAQAAFAQDGATLLDLVNDFRATPHRCGGSPVALSGPLAADSRLAAAQPVAGGDLTETLRSAGYAAARSLAIAVTGPTDAASVMRVLRERYCDELSSARWSEIGVSGNGGRWRIVLAQPLLSPDLEPSELAGRRILDLVNAARAEPRRCGKRAFAAVPAVLWNDALAATANGHSRDMARRDVLSHAGGDGSQVGARASRQGYDWRTVGENVATGQGSARQVMAGWLASPGHCSNIMSGAYTEMGAAYAIDRSSTSTIWWTQVFGRR